MKTGMALRESSVRDGILSRDDTVSFTLKKWSTCRRASLSMWGNKQVICEMGSKMDREGSFFLVSSLKLSLGQFFFCTKTILGNKNPFLQDAS